MQLKMLVTQSGGLSGIGPTYTYEQGRVYDESTDPPVNAYLSEIFVRHGLAEEVGVNAPTFSPEPPAPPQPTPDPMVVKVEDTADGSADTPTSGVVAPAASPPRGKRAAGAATNGDTPPGHMAAEN